MFAVCAVGSFMWLVGVWITLGVIDANSHDYDRSARVAYIVFWPFFAARGLVRSLVHAVKNT